MAAQLEIIKNNSGSLTSLTVDLQAGLNATKDNLTDIQNECNALPGPPPFCNNINTDDLSTQADFSNLPDVSSELKNVDDVVNQNFEQSASDVSDHSHYIFAITGQSLLWIKQSLGLSTKRNKMKWNKMNMFGGYIWF